MARSVGRPLSILLNADTTGFAKGIGTAQSKLERFSGKLESASRKATIAFAGIGAGAFSAVQSASDLNESLSKSTVIFGENSKAMQDWAANAAKSTGLSQSGALEAAGNFAILGKMAGYTGEDLNKFSTDFTQLAADLASFNNTSVDEAIVALGAGLRGESEPLRRFGVLLNAGMVESKALAMGLGENIQVGGKWKLVLSEADKAMARAKIIMEQTSLQQGDFARTADGAANQQRILTAQIENTKAAIGQGLLPIYSQILEKMLGFTNYAQGNSDVVMKLGTVVAGTAGTIIALNYAIKAAQITMTVFTAVAATTKMVMLTLRAATGSAVAMQQLALMTYNNSKVALVAYTVAEKIHLVATKSLAAGQWLLNAAMTANPIGLLVVGIGLLTAAFVIAYKKIEPFRDLVNSIWDKIKGIAQSIGNSKLGKLLGFGGARADGGTVASGMTYLVGERGPELFTPSTSGSIIPNHRLGGGGQVINITMNGVVDGESARRTIERLLQDSARRTGAVNLTGAYA